jgi:hypothetical protein
MSAHPKIQRMCEEESDDHEAVAKLFEINDSINRTVERYKLIKKGDLEGAAKIPKGTLGTSGAGVVKGANNELSLIDLGGPEDLEPAAIPASSNAPAHQASKGNALQDDLLGLSIGGDSYGQGGAVAFDLGTSPGPSNGIPACSSFTGPIIHTNLHFRLLRFSVSASATSLKCTNNQHVLPTLTSTAASKHLHFPLRTIFQQSFPTAINIILNATTAASAKAGSFRSAGYGRRITHTTQRLSIPVPTVDFAATSSASSIDRFTVWVEFAAATTAASTSSSSRRRVDLCVCTPSSTLKHHNRDQFAPEDPLDHHTTPKRTDRNPNLLLNIKFHSIPNLGTDVSSRSDEVLLPAFGAAKWKKFGAGTGRWCHSSDHFTGCGGRSRAWREDEVEVELSSQRGEKG